MSDSLKTQVLNALTSCGYVYASNFPYPSASVRRVMQELRRDGHNIAFAANGQYTLGRPVTYTQSEPQAAV